MPVISRPPRPTHELEGTRFTSLATPSCGSTDTAVWHVEIAAGTPATPAHRLTREEVFIVLDGTASVSLPDGPRLAHAGDAIVVPADVDFVLANDGDDDLRMFCCMPVGGQVAAAEGAFTPPWAE